MGALGVVVAVAVALSVGIGTGQVGPLDAFRVLFRPDSSEAGLVVHSLRLPRTGAGLLVGGALGVAGTLMQGHTRNPLADPGLLGVTAGAAFAVVIAIQAFGIVEPVRYVWFAFAGSAAAAVAVYALSGTRRAAASPASLALAGAAITALLESLSTAVVVLDQKTLNAYRFWSVGSLAGRDLGPLRGLVWFVVLGVVLALLNGPALNALALGEETARGLGHRVGLARAVGMISVALLTGSAVALCGPIGFVGLVVPHAVRALVGPDFRWALPASALAGAALLVLADVVGRVVVAPGELRVGVTMALIGAPLFIALVRGRSLYRP